MRKFLYLVTSLLVLTLSSFATTVRVPLDQPTIQAGIDAANAGDTVLVSCGGYFESNLTLKSGLVVTSESGDFACVTIDAQSAGRVLISIDSDSTTEIIGFTITGGLASGSHPDDFGGGLYLQNSFVQVSNCHFIDNRSEDLGGAFYAEGGHPAFTSCTFADNTADWEGGAAYFRGNSTVSFEECSFEHNWSLNGGGAISCRAGIPSVENCLFLNNNADNWGGAILILHNPAKVSSSVFRNNTAKEGGAIFEIAADYTEYTGNRFEANSATDYGGGLFLDESGYTDVDSCVFKDNYALNGGALFVGGGTNVTVSRSTIVGNQSDVLGGAVLRAARGLLHINNSIVAYNLGGWGIRCLRETDSLDANCCAFFTNKRGDVSGAPFYSGSSGNIFEDPLFCNYYEGELTLIPGSPCESSPTCDQIGALGVACGQLPLPIRTVCVPSVNRYYATSASPSISWSFYDTSGAAQQAYELEVGSDNAWGVAEYWSTGLVHSSDTSVSWGGSYLPDRQEFFIRVRVDNGVGFGGWQVSRFEARSRPVVRVPAHHPTLEEAINDALDGDTILIADGTYTGPGNRDVDLKGRPVVVTSENGPGSCIIDCEGLGRAFSFTSGEDSATVISGLTIQNGAPHGAGGAILMENSSPRIDNCSFVRNVATYGGALYAFNSDDLLVSNCHFKYNVAMSGSSIGGAVYLGNYANSEFVHCVFDSNVAEYGSVLGGGYGATANLKHDTFVRNVGRKGAGVFAYDVVGSLSAEHSIIAYNAQGDEETSAAESFRVHLKYIAFFGNTGGDIFPNVSCFDCPQEDPQFCNVEAGDYHLQPTSPYLPHAYCDELIGALGAGCTTTGIDDEEVVEGLPQVFSLGQNYPNPFNPSTIIEYALPRESDVRLSVYNVLGEVVKILIDGNQPPGFYRIAWDGTDNKGKAVASGVYFYRIGTADYMSSRKMLLLK